MSIDREDSSNGRPTGAVILALILMMAILAGAWPAYRQVTLAGVAALMRPLIQRLHGSEKAGPGDRPARAAQSGLACTARSMEFRLQHLSFDSANLRDWVAEWKLTPPQNPVLLGMLLREMPETPGAKDSPAQKKLVNGLLELAVQGRQADAENGFYWLAEGLALYHIGQETAAIQAFKQIERCARVDAALHELNQSETALWRLERKPWTLFSSTPRIWGLELHRPLYLLSRALAQEERTALKKYNMERAVELGLLQLQLAARIAEMGWTPADVATARAMARRALEPFWVLKAGEPSFVQLQQNFLDLLEDQGDKATAARSHDCLEQIVRRERIYTAMQPTWRVIQQIATWKGSVVLGCLLLEAISVLLTWGTIAVATGGSRSTGIYVGLAPADDPAGGRAASLAFAIAPLFWTVSNWPAGGMYYLLSLLGSWLLWFILLHLRLPPPTIRGWKTAVANVLVMILTATAATTLLLAVVLEYRTRHLEAVLQGGWTL